MLNPAHLSLTPAQAGVDLPRALEGMLHFAVVTASAIGVIVVFYGVLVGFVMWIRVEWKGRRQGDAQPLRAKLRGAIGYYLLLGLEFLIAADILQTLLSPGLQEMLILFGVVLIRTLISFSLNWELQQAAKTERAPESLDSAVDPPDRFHHK